MPLDVRPGGGCYLGVLFASGFVGLSSPLIFILERERLYGSLSSCRAGFAKLASRRCNAVGLVFCLVFFFMFFFKPETQGRSLLWGCGSGGEQTWVVVGAADTGTGLSPGLGGESRQGLGRGFHNSSRSGIETRSPDSWLSPLSAASDCLSNNNNNQEYINNNTRRDSYYS